MERIGVTQPVLAPSTPRRRTMARAIPLLLAALPATLGAAPRETVVLDRGWQVRLARVAEGEVGRRRGCRTVP